MRRARTKGSDEAMFRHSFNYDEQPASSDAAVHGETEASAFGLRCGTFHCDAEQQDIPIQDRLAETDHLNLWTVPTGSAVFAIPGGCQEGGLIGEELFA